MDEIAQGPLEGSALPIHLIHESECRHLAPDAGAIEDLGARLDSRNRAYQHDRAVQSAQGASDLGRKIHMPRRVDKVDMQGAGLADARGTSAFDRGSVVGEGWCRRSSHPLQARSRGLDRYPPLALDLKIIGDRRTIVDVARAANPA